MAKYKNKKSIKWKIKRFLKNWFIIDLMAFLFFILENVFKKNTNRIMFIFGNGEKFSDNSECLFKHLNQYNDHELILFIYNKTLFIELQRTYPNRVYYAYSLKGLACFLRTKIAIISFGIDKLYFFPYYLSPRTKTVIQLWHGSLFKRLGFQVKGWNKIKSKNELLKYSKFIACSSLEQFMISSCFNMSIDDIWITDYPRNDKLFQKNEELLKEHPYLQKKIILYAPTWREEGRKTTFFPFNDANINEIQNFLENTDSYILIRGHNEEIERIRDKYGLSIEDCNRILPADQLIFPNTEELLPFVDILITDYSGIYNDFLLLNRPILFIPYDLDDYSTYRGILFDYNRFTAGPKVFTQKDFLEELQNYINNPSKDEELRIEMRDVFHNYSDGKACERVKKEIDKIK